MKVSVPRAVLFLHAFPLCGEMFTEQVKALEERGIPCLLPDYPGFGTEPPLQGEPSLERFTDHVISQINAFGVREVVVVGVSMGGYIIFDMWRRYRDLLRALVFVATRAEADTEEGRKARYNLIGRIREEGLAPLVETMLENQPSPATKGDEVKMRQLRCMMERATVEGVTAALRALAERRDSTDLLQEIDLPTLVVAGSDDEKITPPEVVRRIAEGIRSAEYVELERSAHLPPFENPEGFNRVLLRFLERVL